MPAIALLPISVAPKRTPSSSPKPTISSVYGSRLPRVVQILDAGDRGDDAEEAVVLAGVAHAVLMRAGHHDRRLRIGGLVAADDVAERVESARHAGVAA